MSQHNSTYTDTLTDAAPQPQKRSKAGRKTNEERRRRAEAAHFTGLLDVLNEARKAALDPELSGGPKVTALKLYRELLRDYELLREQADVPQELALFLDELRARRQSH